MTDTLFSAIQLEDDPDRLVGYRLHGIEVFNWGTFDRSVWTVKPEGRTSLLTGDIGSGKSTIVDAITTLLLPANRIAYNKAAGADVKERTLRSYVEGHYRSERNEATGASRPVGLRDHRRYSVILGSFHNVGYDEWVTIAQVFHQQDRSGQPDRFFVTASRAMSIEADFSGFGSDLKTLRARLRSSGADIDTVFPEYQRRLRRLLGIRSEQAMELFHQTVSMKSVGNLNEFVRSHMLEPADAGDRVRSIVEHFENLTRAHEAVRRATDQLSVLDPLVASADSFDAVRARQLAYQGERDAIGPYTALLALEVLEASTARSSDELGALELRSAAIAAARRALQPERERLIAERTGVGGDRLQALEAELPRAAAQVEERAERRARFAALLTEAVVADVENKQDFEERIREVASAEGRFAEAKRAIEERAMPLRDGNRDGRRDREVLEREIRALEQQGSNLPAGLVPLRYRLCADLRLPADALPFVAELLDVRPAAAEWRGAAERVLRPFALNLLVPQSAYSRVSRWVNEHHLAARLVYLRVADRRVRLLAPGARVEGDARLADIVTVESGPFEEFVRSELSQRADYRLVDDVAALEREDRAVTREGLVRDRDRHEKDDRNRADDPRGWVLGRATEQKLQVLRVSADELAAQAVRSQEELTALAHELDALQARHRSLAALAQFRSWRELDVDMARANFESLVAERARLVAGSSQLAEIDLRLADLGREDAALGSESGLVSEDVGRVRAELDRSERRAASDRSMLRALGDEVVDRARQHFDALTERVGSRPPDTVEACDLVRESLQKTLTNAIETAQHEMNGHTTSILRHMHEALRRWPELRAEMDATVQSIGEFRALHERVTRDDLPRFEAEFKTQLNTNAVRELAQFTNWLNRQAGDIHARVDRINEALGAIDYNPGRRIELIAEPTVNQEVGQFRLDLREATGDLLAAEQGDAEARFERVRVVIERFQGREGHADADRGWTRRVTDVRNWFTFAASERDNETGREFEHYTDSDGKSGGQKEKLAYTILAASLAYQFGLEWGSREARDFRFAVIDEAFGRGSDISTQYALDLFRRLGLQLLIVTPMQKVHVIEPYVHTIGFVDNPTGAASRVHTLTVEEFRERRNAVRT